PGFFHAFARLQIPSRMSDTCVIFSFPTCPAAFTDSSQSIAGCGVYEDSWYHGSGSDFFSVASDRKCASIFCDESYGRRLFRNFALTFLDQWISSGRINPSPARITAVRSERI